MRPDAEHHARTTPPAAPVPGTSCGWRADGSLARDHWHDRTTRAVLTLAQRRRQRFAPADIAALAHQLGAADAIPNAAAWSALASADDWHRAFTSTSAEAAIKYAAPWDTRATAPAPAPAHVAEAMTEWQEAAEREVQRAGLAQPDSGR